MFPFAVLLELYGFNKNIMAISYTPKVKKVTLLLLVKYRKFETVESQIDRKYDKLSLSLNFSFHFS